MDGMSKLYRLVKGKAKNILAQSFSRHGSRPLTDEPRGPREGRDGRGTPG